MSEEQDWKNLNIIDKIEHKNWNARVEGYKEALSEMSKANDSKDPLFNSYIGVMKKMVIDSNVVAQEKALEVVLYFVEEANVAGKVAGEMCSGLVTKCLSSARPNTRDRAVAILKMLIEIEKHEVVIEELMKGLSSKTPKVVIGCIIVIREALREFGPKIVPIKELFKVLPQLLEDRDKGVREAGKELIVEIYRWIGKQAITPQLSNFKPVQVTELNTEFEKISTEKAVPTRYLKSQKPKVVAQPKLAGTNESPSAATLNTSAEPAIDPYDFIDPVEVISKVPNDFYDKIEEKKWTDRKDALEVIEKLTNHEKLVPGEFGDLVKTLLKVLAKDTNVVLVVLAAKVLYQIAHGLRKKYSPYATTTVDTCLEKFKEKKANVVKGLRDCIDASFYASTLDAISESVVNALAHKTPSVRSETCLFLNRIFEKSTMETLPKKHLKTFVPNIVKLCQDSVPEVRDASFLVLGTAMMVVTEKHIKPFMDGIDAVKTARIMECYEKAKADASEAVKVPAVVATEPVKVKESPKDIKPKSEKAAVPKAPPKKAAVAQKTQKKPGVTGAESEIPKEPLLSDEDVIAKGTELFGEAFMTQVADKSFNERLAAVQTLQAFIKDKPPSEIPSQLIIKLILLKPGLKDNNVQVLKTKFELIKSVVMNGKFTLTIAELCIGELTEKIGDPKNGDHVKGTLTEMSDSLNLQCVATQVIKTATENVNVKNIAEALIWIGNSIKDFGFKIEMKDLLPFIRTGLQHTNPSVRQSALKLVGTVSLYVRDLIATLLKDEKSSIKQLIDQEVESMKAQEPPLPTRGLKNAKPTAAGDADIDPPATAAHFEIDDLIPRENISGKITEDMLTQLADKSWKVKKEALDEITKILDKCTGIFGDGLQPLMAAVSKITTDSSKVISKIALTVLSSICKLMTKKDSERYVKIIIPALFSSCSDAKPKNREDSVATINTWVEKVGFAAVAEGGMIADALKVESPFQKTEILAWISPHLTAISENKLLRKTLPAELGSDLLPLLYMCLEERNADVRKKAQEAVLPFMLVYGYEEMLKIHSKHTKAASKDNIKAYLDASRKNLPPPVAVAVKQVDKVQTEATKAASAGKKESLSKKTEESAVNKVKREDAKDAETAKPEEIMPLLQISSDKKKRLVEDSKKKNLTKAEIAQQINTYFTGNCNQELMNNLFSTDFKKHIIAIELLSRFLNEDNPQSIEATKQNLDLILKWLVVRFDETNTSVVNKGLEYLAQVFTVLPKDENFSLHTQEANNFIPEFLLKLGDGNVNIRTNAQKILKLLLNCYQAKFVVPFIERVLFETKLAKVKQGCSEFTQLLIDDRRIKPSENIPLLVTISKLISDRENSIRSAALDCLVSAHNHMGEKMFDKLKELNEKDRSMLSERIRRTGRPVLPNTDSSSATTSTATTTYTSTEKTVKPMAQSQQKPNNVASQPALSKPASFDANPILREEVGLKLINVDQEIKELLQPLEKLTLRFSGRISQTVNSNDAITSVIHSINSNDVQTSIQAMAQIDEVIKNQDVRPQLLTFMDNLVMSITMQLKATLGKLSEDGFKESEITDMFKGMLATLVSIFSYKDLAAELNRDRLMSLMQVILRLVINDQLVALAEGGTIIRGINILSVKILEFSNQTRMLSSLLRMMMDCLKNNDSASKYLQLIFKCIWSMTKNLVKTVNTIDLVVILKDIQIFYNDFPPQMWESSHQDVPMRTVKTIVYSIINHKGSGVLEALYQIPNAPGKELDQYIRKSYAKLKYPIPTVLPTAVDVKEEVLKSVDKQRNVPKSTTRPYLDELKQVFQKIGDPKNTKEGLNNLYDFKIKYPYVDLSRYLNQTSAYFMRTIENGLLAIAEERGQPMISLLGSNESSQLNNSGATALLDKDSMAYCDMDPDTLMRRLKNLRIKAGLDKPHAEPPQVTSPPKDEMDVSTIGPLNPSGDGPPTVVPNQNRRMSASDLNQYRQRLNNVAKNPR